MNCVPNIRPLDELDAFELEAAWQDPSHYTVIGAADFVLGRVRRLLVDLDGQEVVYLVVNTRVSNFPSGVVEERLVPLAWGELLHARRQIRLPQLTRLGFMRLPLYQPEAVPANIPFPSFHPDDPDVRDIA